ncbi:MAG: hypothetical protein KDK70_43880, partial [Myxococcales bacterium]|nr:hypothetical protein [Myxococcales bacterium]
MTQQPSEQSVEEPVDSLFPAVDDDDSLGAAPAVSGYAMQLAELRLRHRMLGADATLRIDRFTLER